MLGATRGTPPPHNLAWAFGQDATSGIAHPRGGGGGLLQLNGPSGRGRQWQVRRGPSSAAECFQNPREAGVYEAV